MLDVAEPDQPWLPEVYDCLRQLAAAWFRAERPGHTLQPTALVHEAYMRLNAGERKMDDKARFGAAAAIAMRRVLVDHARARGAAKRGSGWGRLDLALVDAGGGQRDVGVLELDEALEALGAEHERCARVVELRFFGGLTVDQTATVLDVSARTVDLDWRFARAWLLDRIESAS